MTIIDQQYIDNLVLWTSDKKTDLAAVVCESLANGDPAYNELVLKLMAVQVLMTSIRDYDITWDVFTENELLEIEERIMNVLQTCPNWGGFFLPNPLVLLQTYNLDVPDGWLVPTEAELEAERLSWSSDNLAGAFASPLKLPTGGVRSWGDGSASELGTHGNYWSRSIDDIIFPPHLYSANLRFDVSGATVVGISINRAYGLSVRLIKQEGLPLVAGDQTFTYNGAVWTYREVESNGRIWMDRNLGASQVASAFDDALSYGDLFQWGRNDDGHQVKAGGTTATLSNSDTPGHGDFIVSITLPRDWRDPQNNDLWQPI